MKESYPNHGKILSKDLDLLRSQMKRLDLKGKKFNTFDAASDEEIEALWAHCFKIEKDLKVC